MAYSLEKCRKISQRVDEVGIHDTAHEMGVSMDTVKRALRDLRKHEGKVISIESDDRQPCRINTGKERVLIIGDLHAPFDLDAYFDFCVSVSKTHKPTQVVFIGDVIDNHFASYHETDPDGKGGRDELDLAIERLSRWYQTFPKAYVTIGNHDRMVMRKSQTSQVPKRWIRSYKEVLETPGWYFTDRVDIDGVQYIHGEGGTARRKCKEDMMSTVQGHLHTQAYVEWQVGRNLRVFGMQVGCGIDAASYAMAYAKSGKKPAIGCGTVLHGEVAVNHIMEL